MGRSVKDRTEYTRYTIRVPTPLYEKLQEAAGEKSINAEVVERLEDSFESLAGYKELTELFLETMQENAASAKRELLEYRQMVGTVRLMRHTIDRFIDHFSGQAFPDDIQMLVGILTPHEDTKEPNIEAIMVDVVDAMEKHQDLIKSDEAGGYRSKEYRDSIRQRLLKLQDKFARIVDASNS